MQRLTSQSWWPRIKGPVRAIVFGYILAFMAVNAVNSPQFAQSPLHAVALALVPRIGSSNDIDQQSVANEWSVVQNHYVIRGVSGSGGTLAAEQGIINYLHDNYNDR